MTECRYPEITDSLPDLLHGRLGEVDTATLTAHVESCAACRAELVLLSEVRATARLSPRIDVDRVVASLPLRSVVVPESPRRPAASGIRSPVWKFAAVIAIAISGGLLVQDRGAVADSPSTSIGSLSLVAGVHELTDDQIESLLVELEAIETTPSAEPEQGILYREQAR